MTTVEIIVVHVFLLLMLVWAAPYVALVCMDCAGILIGNWLEAVYDLKSYFKK